MTSAGPRRRTGTGSPAVVLIVSAAESDRWRVVAPACRDVDVRQRLAAPGQKGRGGVSVSRIPTPQLGSLNSTRNLQGPCTSCTVTSCHSWRHAARHDCARPRGSRSVQVAPAPVPCVDRGVAHRRDHPRPRQRHALGPRHCENVQAHASNGRLLHRAEPCCARGSARLRAHKGRAGSSCTASSSRCLVLERGRHDANSSTDDRSLPNPLPHPSPERGPASFRRRKC